MAGGNNVVAPSFGIKRPKDGKILLNGKDVTGNWDAAHNYFSYVNQKPFMFDDTLRFNITLGRKVSDEKLKQVIHEAGLDNLVKSQGLDKQVGEMVVNCLVGRFKE